ncbi:Elongation of fatty acids protein 2 [Glugoides intestinalis]
MGIKQLSKLIKEKCKKAIITRKSQYYSSSKIAIDASLALYQFLIAVRSGGSTLGYGDSTTSHLVGIFYRTIKMVENGIVPVYVFDGKAPAMKAIELQKRSERRQKAEKEMESAKLDNDQEEAEKHKKRTVKVEETHVNDSKKLLKLMGIPFVDAASESEAYCAFLCKQGAVKAVATEDMDALCFGTPILLRNMNASQAKKLDIDEYRLEFVLKELELTMDSFIDMCILMGCDYCDTIKGIGYKRAYELIKNHGTIEKIIEFERLEVGENFDFQSARNIFKELSSVGESESFEIMYDEIDKEGLIEFLVGEKGFDEQRVINGIEKIIKARKTGNQTRLDCFFNKK